MKGRDWKPPPTGGKGELRMGVILQNAGIRFKYQVPIKTRFSPYTFLVDYVTAKQQSWTEKLLTPVAIEIQGGLHTRTWRGRPALHRMAKDEAKKNCLLASGYGYIAPTDKEVLNEPDKVLHMVRIEMRLHGTKKPNLNR